ncbi:MAG: M12 family metallopeptidase [Granulosicoccus sp.]
MPGPLYRQAFWRQNTARLYTSSLCVLALLAVGYCTPVVASETSNPQSSGSLRIIDGDVLTGPRLARRGVGLSTSGSPWSDGTVPFVVDAGLPAISRIAILEAVKQWNAVSGITLYETGRGTANPSDYIRFQTGPGCASWVGRQGGEQEVWIAPSCSAGSVMHEIGHALGLEHEHTRSDRDQHIQINWDNIDPEKWHNFDKAPASAELLGDYDYDSIMHYGRTNFSVNGMDTIAPLANAAPNLGQRSAPSAGDIASIARLYASDLSLATKVTLLPGLTEVTLYVTNNVEQGAHGVQIRLLLGERYTVAQTESAWLCQADTAGAVLCSLDRLAGGESSQVTLTINDELQLDNISAEVISKTPDSNMSNNHDQPYVGNDSIPEAGAARSILADGGKDVSYVGAGYASRFALIVLAGFGLLRRRQPIAQ